MSKLICGIHHVAIRCHGLEMLEKDVAFYHDVLGMDILRRWGEGDKTGVMIDTGSGILELFANGESDMPLGHLPHVALRTQDVDACMAAATANGCEVIMAPKDIVIQADHPLPARIAFCRAPAGEEVEFFCE